MRNALAIVLVVTAADSRAECFVGALAGVQDAPKPRSTPPETQQVEAGPIRLELTLDRTTMNAAETLDATLDVISEPAVVVELPAASDKLGEFSVESSSDDPPVAASGDGPGRTRLRRRFRLTPFLPGEYTLPALDVRWRRAGTDVAGVARTAPVTVRVVSLLPEHAQNAEFDVAGLDPGSIRDAYTAREPRDWTDVSLLAAGIAGAALLTGCGVAWGVAAWRRRRVERDELAQAVERVRSLGSRADATTERCHELAESLRLGLRSRFGAGATTWSAEELEARIPRTPSMSDANVRSLRETLERLDAIRFSGRPVEPREFQELVSSVASGLQVLAATPRPGKEAP